MKRYIFTYNGLECRSLENGITVYPNDTAEKRVIMADEFDFRYSLLLIFGGDGLLHEVGSNLLANKDGKLGSPQISVKVPAGGFLVACGYGAPTEMIDCYNTANEGAMLYNATRIATFEMYGALDRVNNKLTIYYDEPERPSEDAEKFLFVGNSNTYFQGTPMLFRNMCRAAGLDVEVDYCTFGSAYLSEFADPEHERGKALRTALEAKEYDYIIMQDASAATFETAKKALDVIMPLVEENGGEPVLYMRYSGVSGDLVNDTKRLYDIYTALAGEYKINCIPSALACLECSKKNPEIPLYADDMAHHSPEAAYLIAATWLYCLTGVSPVGNSFDPHFDPEVIAALQKIAAKVCKKNVERQKYAFAKRAIGVASAALGVIASVITVAAVLRKKKNSDDNE